MTTYYAVANCNGMISRRITAASAHDALSLATESGRDWIDEPATDADDDFGFVAADMPRDTCDDLLSSAGLACVIASDDASDWEIWS